MCQLLRVMRLGFPDRRMIFVGDAGYGTHEVARFAQRYRLGNYPKTGCNPRKIQDLRTFSDSY